LPGKAISTNYKLTKSEVKLKIKEERPWQLRKTLVEKLQA